MKTTYLKKTKYWICIIIIILIVIIDVSSKEWIINNIKIYETKKICSILNIFHVHNYGAAFSFLCNQKGWQRWFLSFLAIFSIFFMINIIKKCRKTEMSKVISYSLIIGGAIGNLIDRVTYGFVIDFFDIHIYNWHFAIFNIADCSIFLGVIILIKKSLASLFLKFKKF